VFEWIGMSSAQSGVLNAFVRFGKWALVRVRVQNVGVWCSADSSSVSNSAVIIFSCASKLENYSHKYINGGYNTPCNARIENSSYTCPLCTVLL